MNIAIDFYDKNKNYNNLDTLVIIHQREDYYKIKEKLSNFTEFKEHAFTINWDNKFFDITVFSKNKTIKYTSTKLLRNVLAPYVVKDENGVAQPRGWFYGDDGKPQRYTGVSNSMYFSKSKWDKTFSVPFLYLLTLMFTNLDDTVSSNIEDYSIINNKVNDFMQYAEHHFIVE